ncbi:MAG: SpoIIE family protein phosphatase [Bacteroidota bacterium]|nr:SpoIIE family protein phosphatase [Bacteroidota bacterium]
MEDKENIKVKRNLSALVEFSRVINSSLDLGFILNNILLTCMGKFLASKCYIALKIEGNVELKAIKGFKADTAFPKIKIDNGPIDCNDLAKFNEENNIVLCDKIVSSNDCIGIFAISGKLNKHNYSEDDQEFLRTILNISATAIQNSIVLDELKVMNKLLDSRLHKISSLFELSKEFGMLSESKRVAKMLIYSVIGQFLISKFAVVTFDPLTGIRILESKYNDDDLKKALSKYDISGIHDPIFKAAIEEKYPKLALFGLELIVPMQIQGKTKGLMLLGGRMSDLEYTESDVEYIYSAGSIAIISLENRRLFKEEIEKQKMEEELEIARDIQKNLLPHQIPEFRNIEVAATNISSKQVGGDFYDIIPLSDHSFCAAIADVSGKGVPAALLMANLQAFLKIICKHGMQLVEATALINDLITENTMDGKFITYFWGIFDDNNRTFQYVNAGHNPPLLIRDGKITYLKKGGIILGVMKTFTPYLSETIQLEKDDVIVLFTDGITEAKNINDDEFSDEKLETLALNLSGFSPDRILEYIKESVQEFSVGTHQSDDITLMVLKLK